MGPLMGASGPNVLPGFEGARLPPRPVPQASGGRLNKADGGELKIPKEILPSLPGDEFKQDKSTGQWTTKKWGSDKWEPSEKPKKSGGRLTAKERQGLPKSDFALPGHGKGPKGAGAGSYPINNPSHARNALARVSQHGSPEIKAKVRAKVHAKYPDIEISKK